MEKVKFFFEEIYRNFNERKIDDIIVCTTNDVKWANGMEGGFVHGHDELRAYWLRQFSIINPTVIPEDISEIGGIVKIEAHQVVRDLEGKIIMDKYIYHHFFMDHDKIAKFEIGDDFRTFP